jgi:hypothetical protein
MQRWENDERHDLQEEKPVWSNNMKESGSFLELYGS